MEWKAIIGWEHIYAISDEGEVMNVLTRKILKPMRTGSKRPGAQRSKVRFSTTPRLDFDVAHLVLQHFVGPRPEGMIAMHEDDDSANNRKANLKWGTTKKNSEDMAKRGRAGNQKLNALQCLEIIRCRMDGETGKSIAERFGVSQQRVCDIFKGRTSFRHTK